MPPQSKGKERKLDPNRQKRIDEMLQNEKELRDMLEKTNQMARDLRHHVHYDQIQNERAAIISNLAPEIQGLFHSCMDLRASCIVAESHLEQKCEMRRKELDKLKGLTPEPTPDEDPPLTDSLPPEQANALRFVTELNRMNASKVSSADVLRLTNQFAEMLNNFEEKTNSYREAVADILVVFQKKIERGWMSDDDLKSFKSHLEGSVVGLPEIVPDHRRFLDDWKKDCETLLSRIENLDAEIEQIRRNK